MRIYRTIGAIIGSFVTPIFIFLLCAAIILSSAANLLTENGIEHIVARTMKDQNVKNSLSDVFMESDPTNSDKQNANIQNSFEKITELSSVQNVVSNIVYDSIHEITSGSFDGELDVQEKLQSTITEDQKVLPSLSEDIARVMLEDEAFRASLISSLVGDDTLNPLGEDLLDRLMKEPSIQKIASQIVSYSLENEFGLSHATTVDIAKEMSDLMKENPKLSEEVVNALLPDSESFYNAVADAAAYAKEAGVPEPAVGISKMEFAEYYLHLYSYTINENVRNTIFQYEADVDYTDYTELQEDAYTVQFDAKTVEILNHFSVYLNFLQSPAFILGIIFAFFAFYLLMSLLTWSFRYPLIFNAILALFVGIALIAVSMIPFSALAFLPAGEMTAVSFALLNAIWGVLANTLMLIGTGGIVISIACMTIFIITGIAKKNKAQAI
jgi:hypothetical protein